MSDVKELAQRMKAAALNATPGRIGDRIDGTGSIKYQCFGNDGSLVLQTDHKNMEYGFIGPNSKADELFFRECSPENVQVLAEALEARDKQIDILRQDKDTVIDTSLERINKILSRAEAAEKRIAEQEALAVKLPPLNEALIVILGRPNFICSFLAELLRKNGRDIARKSEHEQATVIYWLLNIYFEHGEKWESVANADLQLLAAGVAVEGE